jgi:hypothetical protein
MGICRKKMGIAEKRWKYKLLKKDFLVLKKRWKST